MGDCECACDKRAQNADDIGFHCLGMPATAVIPLGTQSGHFSIGSTVLKNRGNSLAKSEVYLLGLCDSHSDIKPDTTGAA